MKKLKLFLVCTVISVIGVFGLTGCFGNGSNQQGTGNGNTNQTTTGNNNSTTGSTNNGSNGMNNNNTNGTNGTNGNTNNNMNGTTNGNNNNGNTNGMNDNRETNTDGDGNIIDGVGDIINDGLDEIETAIDDIDGNKVNGNNLFFPIGASGYGRRRTEKSWYSSGISLPGALQYAWRSKRYSTYSDAWSTLAYRPMFENVYMRPGAVYWCEKLTNDQCYLDVNYFTLDFSLGGNEPLQGENGSACFIRCVEDVTQ